MLCWTEVRACYSKLQVFVKPIILGWPEVSSYLLPYCKERKSKKEPKRAAKLGDQGGERVEQDFFFDLGFMGGSRPEGNRSWIRDWIWAAFNKSPGILWRQESQREEGEGQCWNRKSRLEATSWMPSLLPLSSPVPNQLLNPDQWPWTNALQWSIEALTNQSFYSMVCAVSAHYWQVYNRF